MKITEYKTKSVPEIFTDREYLQFRANWGRLVLDETKYLLTIMENDTHIYKGEFKSRAKARLYALKYKNKTKATGFTIMKNLKMIERMEF